MPDDDLESAYPLFLQRFRDGKVPVKEALSILELGRWRLQFLRDLRQSTNGIAEFARQDAEVGEAIEEQARETRELEQLLEERNISPSED
jgi:hypothetical protein